VGGLKSGLFVLQSTGKGDNMTAVAEKVLESAMGLSPVDRAELIERLFLSFDKTADHTVEEAWKAETESRINAYDAGGISASSADEVFNRISER
jgi:putative addiction module component (TIGR02574 family)